MMGDGEGEDKQGKSTLKSICLNKKNQIIKKLKFQSEAKLFLMKLFNVLNSNKDIN